LRIKSKKLKIGLTIIIFFFGSIIFCIYENNSIVITKSNFSSPKITSDFDGFTIAQISDLHNKLFGDDQAKILNKLKSISPDIIVVTGDLIDRRKYNLDIAMTFISGAVKIAPVYYVSGNHEAWSGNFPLIKKNLVEAGVNVLDDITVELTKGKTSINIIGLSDPDFLTSDYIEGTNTSKAIEQLKQWSMGKNLKILLSHRTELFDLYSENSAHGGQIRIPFIGGLIAPDQGIFPKYSSGSYGKDSTTMFVSRGLGNSIFPVRVFNRPEIVVVTLRNLK